MKHFILKTLYAFAVSAMLFSCTKEHLIDSTTLPDGYTKLKEGYAIGASTKIEIWGKNNFFSGYNNLTVVLYDSLNLHHNITDAHIHFMPVMTTGMGKMQSEYLTPVEDPDESAINGVFPGAIAFIMPTSTDKNWTLEVAVHNHELNKEGVADFDIVVDNSTVSNLIMFKSQSADSTSLVLTLVEPVTPKVGINDIEFTVHRMIKMIMMEYISDDSYTFEISPVMTGMGTSPASNISLANTGNGHYKGKVDFNMKGTWQVNVLLKQGGKTISKNPSFNFIL